MNKFEEKILFPLNIIILYTLSLKVLQHISTMVSPWSGGWRRSRRGERQREGWIGRGSRGKVGSPRNSPSFLFFFLFSILFVLSGLEEGVQAKEVHPQTRHLDWAKIISDLIFDISVVFNVFQALDSNMSQFQYHMTYQLKGTTILWNPWSLQITQFHPPTV